MKRMDPARIASARKSLRKKKVFAFPSLLSLLNCSTRTGRKQLKQWRTYNSYNLNARFYALPEVPRFDDNGLWKCKDAYFSKHGTLKRTVVSLVQNSLSGLDGNEISKLVGLPHQSFLHHFRDVPGMRREKHDGVFV